MAPTVPSLTVQGMHAPAPGAALEVTEFTRHTPGPKDVVIAVKYCGVCHTDVHACKDPPGSFGAYPVLPGHEACGVITWIGDEVTKFKVGDHAGVGCMVDSCLSCEYCDMSEEQYCDTGSTFTYGAEPKYGRAGTEKTRGGYSSLMVVQEHFTVLIPKSLPLEVAGPIMCAGITMYDPLVHWSAGSEHCKRIGIVGGGGLGHMGIQLAKALGCTVTCITTSPSKAEDLKKLGADSIVLSTDPDAMKAAARTLDLILNTVSANHDMMAYHKLLRPNGTLVQLGLVNEPHSVDQVSMLWTRAGISGSLIGGMRATQEVVDLCAEKQIYPKVKVVPCSQVNEVFAELDAKSSSVQRFVLDIGNTLDEFAAAQQQKQQQ